MITLQSICSRNNMELVLQPQEGEKKAKKRAVITIMRQELQTHLGRMFRISQWSQMMALNMKLPMISLSLQMEDKTQDGLMLTSIALYH